GTGTSTHDEIKVSGEKKKEINEHDVAVDMEQDAIAVIRENLDAVNKRDVDTYVTHILNAPDNFKEELSTTFTTYDNVGLKMEFVSGEALYAKDDEIVLKVLQTNRTDEFNPNQNFQSDATALHVLKLTEDGWKFSNTITIKQNWLLEDGSLDETGETFPNTDIVETWDNHIKEMKAQDILPSEYIKNLNNEEEQVEEESMEELSDIQERDLQQPGDLVGIAKFLINHYAQVYTVETEVEYKQIIAESFTNYDENYAKYLDAFTGDYTAVETEVSLDESSLMEYSDFRFGGVIDVTFYLTTPDGQTETVTHFGYFEFDRPTVDDNYKIVSIQ